MNAKDIPIRRAVLKRFGLGGKYRPHQGQHEMARRRRQIERGIYDPAQLEREEDMAEKPIAIGQVYEDWNPKTWFTKSYGGEPKRLIRIVDVRVDGYVIAESRHRTSPDQDWAAAVPASKYNRTWRIKATRFRTKKYYRLLQEDVPGESSATQA